MCILCVCWIRINDSNRTAMPTKAVVDGEVGKVLMWLWVLKVCAVEKRV